eukprot:15433711-Alexandrium_andersonii.AAC.1
MANWLSGSQRRAAADTVPGLVEDSAATPGTPDTAVSLDDNIPDVGDCAICRQPIPEGEGGAFTCGHRTHDTCLRDHRDRHGPAAGCPSCGPEYVITDKRGTDAEDNPRRCAVRRGDTGGPAGPEAEQWPGRGHLLHRGCADGVRALAG